jgi:signal transduction histidine kinase/ActR/RegA family two-component response regulator
VGIQGSARAAVPSIEKFVMRDPRALHTVRRALDDARDRAAPAVLGGLSMLLLAGAVLDAFSLGPAVRWPSAGFDLTVAVACAMLGARWRRGRFRSGSGDVVWVTAGVLVAADLLATMVWTDQPTRAGYLMLIFVGEAVVLSSPFAFGVVVALVVAGWAVSVRSWGHKAALGSQAPEILTASLTGGLLFAGRLRSRSHWITRGFRDWTRNDRLRRALASARSIIDESIRSETERERLRAALVEAQKLEAVGRLAGAVAHDINNVLTAILSAAEMLLADADLDATGREDVATILASARRGGEFTRNLLAVGLRGKYASDLLDPADVVRAAQEAIEHSLPVEVRVEVEFGHGDERVKGDLSQLTLAVVNMCSSAVHAMPDGGTLTVRTACVTIEGMEAHRRAVVPGEYVAISVSDSGEGLDSEDRQRAFEPFYATRAAHLGAALGLPMAYGAARTHGGNAELESIRGRGTTVTMHLPRVADRPSLQQSSAPEGVRRTDLRGSKVLLVDDEASVRAVARRILERMELVVHEAENGRKALVAHSSEGPFDLVLVDWAMPVMGGRELFARLRAAAPEARVIFVASAREIADTLPLVEAGAIGIVEKPYTPAGLAAAVQAALRPAPSIAPRVQSA